MNALVAVQTTVFAVTPGARSPRRFIAPRPYLGQAWKRHRDVPGNHGNPGCRGVLRWIDAQHAIPLAKCDGCGYELAVKQ